MSGTETWQDTAADPHHGAVSLRPVGPQPWGQWWERCCVELNQAPVEQHSAGPGGFWGEAPPSTPFRSYSGCVTGT